MCDRRRGRPRRPGGCASRHARRRQRRGRGLGGVPDNARLLVGTVPIAPPCPAASAVRRARPLRAFAITLALAAGAYVLERQPSAHDRGRRGAGASTPSTCTPPRPPTSKPRLRRGVRCAYRSRRRTRPAKRSSRFDAGRRRSAAPILWFPDRKTMRPACCRRPMRGRARKVVRARRLRGRPGAGRVAIGGPAAHGLGLRRRRRALGRGATLQGCRQLRRRRGRRDGRCHRPRPDRRPRQGVALATREHDEHARCRREDQPDATRRWTRVTQVGAWVVVDDGRTAGEPSWVADGTRVIRVPGVNAKRPRTANSGWSTPPPARACGRPGRASSRRRPGRPRRRQRSSRTTGSSRAVADGSCDDRARRARRPRHRRPGTGGGRIGAGTLRRLHGAGGGLGLFNAADLARTVGPGPAQRPLRHPRRAGPLVAPVRLPHRSIAGARVRRGGRASCRPASSTCPSRPPVARRATARCRASTWAPRRRACTATSTATARTSRPHASPAAWPFSGQVAEATVQRLPGLVDAEGRWLTPRPEG